MADKPPGAGTTRSKLDSVTFTCRRCDEIVLMRVRNTL
jgi:hypothetical protein